MLKRIDKFSGDKIRTPEFPFHFEYKGNDLFIVKKPYNLMYFISWHFKHAIFKEVLQVQVGNNANVFLPVHVFLSFILLTDFWKSHHISGEKSFLQHACFLTPVDLPPFGNNMMVSGVTSPYSL